MHILSLNQPLRSLFNMTQIKITVLEYKIEVSPNL